MGAGAAGRSDRPLFVATIGLSAFLLFSLELLVGRLVLPVFGGTPGAWATGLCFFSAMVFAGYLYAHAVATRLSLRTGRAVHLAVAAAVVVATAFVPERVADLVLPGLAPAVNVLAVFALLAGPQAFLLSTTTPLLSAWYSRGGRDPWWLYAVSNAASLAGLLAYPLLVEPTVPLSAQRWLVLAGLVALLAALAAIVVRGRGGDAVPAGAAGPRRDDGPGAPTGEEPGPRPTRRQQALWLLAAFVPAGLLSATTTHIATDHISTPLLWIGPLGIYLASFVVAFSARGRRALPVVERLVPAAATLMWIPWVARVSWPAALLVPTLLLSFGVIALAVHGRLALDRPSETYLTRFYVLVSAGGLAATAFVALLAPVVFDDIYEYPLLVVAALAVLAMLPGPAADAKPSTPTARLGQAALRAAPLMVAGAALVWAAASYSASAASLVGVVTVIGVLVVFVAGGSRWALAGASALAVVLLAMLFSPSPMLRVRSFFGVTQVRLAARGGATEEIHGTTLHGLQLAGSRRTEPTSYFVRSGPLGDVVRVVCQRTPDGASVGVVGLGVGTIAAYARPSDTLTFFELDRDVADIAADTRYFTYLADAADAPKVVLGDGRLSLAARPAGSYDLVVLDAFASDAVPAHLLTREAVRTYVRVLRSHGLVAFQLTNRHFDLVPAVASTARSLGLAARACDFTPGAADARDLAAKPSRWLVVGRPGDLAAFRAPRWSDAARGPVLTDDFSDMMWLLRAW